MTATHCDVRGLVRDLMSGQEVAGGHGAAAGGFDFIDDDGSGAGVYTELAIFDERFAWGAGIARKVCLGNGCVCTGDGSAAAWPAEVGADLALDDLGWPGPVDDAIGFIDAADFGGLGIILGQRDYLATHDGWKLGCEELGAHFG